MATEGKGGQKPKRRLVAKRVRIDSAEGAVASIANAALAPVQPPACVRLRDRDRPFWDSIMRARARDEWGRNELVLAGQLARTQGDIAWWQELLDAGDRERMDEAGFPSVRALCQAVSGLVNQQMVLMRALRIVGTVVGDPIDEVPRRQAEREAERTLLRMRQAAAESDEPPLLAT